VTAIQRLMVDGQATPFSHYCHVVRAGGLIWVHPVRLIFERFILLAPQRIQSCVDGDAVQPVAL
jgi:hypothetical protein